jgi:hypothetical protein
MLKKTILNNENGELTDIGYMAANQASPAAASAYKNFIQPMYVGDQSRLDEIKKAQADALNSPYNVASVVKPVDQAYLEWTQAAADAKKRSTYGFSPQERAAMENEYAGLNAMNTQNALNTAGGQFAPYLNAVNNSNANNYELNLAKLDKEQQRANLGMYYDVLGRKTGVAGAYQDAFNKNFEKELMTEQALGQAQSDWYSNRAADRRALISTGAALAGAGIKAGA